MEEYHRRLAKLQTFWSKMAQPDLLYNTISDHVHTPLPPKKKNIGQKNPVTSLPTIFISHWIFSAQHTWWEMEERCRTGWSHKRGSGQIRPGMGHNLLQWGALYPIPLPRPDSPSQGNEDNEWLSWCWSELPHKGCWELPWPKRLPAAKTPSWDAVEAMPALQHCSEDRIGHYM